MADKIVNYQCPACGGSTHYDGAKGKLVCDYCDSEYTVEEAEALFAAKEAEAQKAAEAERSYDDSGEDWTVQAGMKAYNCPSCGAQLICDETTAATSCPYCGNKTVMVSQFAKTLKPDYVLPFKLDKKDAVAALKKHYAHKPLLPSAFTNSNHIEEIKGVYVPFWLYDAECDADARYTAQRISVFREGQYEVTKTDHFILTRSGSVSFEKVPVDGSSKADNDFMDSIEPFDYSDLKPFSTAYLPGYLADRYDEDSKMCADRANLRMKNSTFDELDATTGGYMTVSRTQERIKINPKDVKYALMPVWMLNTKWNGKNYMFAMNGQTGKLIGDLPVSNGKRLGYFFGAAAVTFVVGFAVMAIGLL